MRKVIAVVSVIACSQWLVGAERAGAPGRAHPHGVPQASASDLIDYWTDGADIERSGWIKNEKILTKANVGTLKLKWKLETGNQPRALHTPLALAVVGQ